MGISECIHNSPAFHDGSDGSHEPTPSRAQGPRSDFLFYRACPRSDLFFASRRKIPLPIKSSSLRWPSSQFCCFLFASIPPRFAVSTTSEPCPSQHAIQIFRVWENEAMPCREHACRMLRCMLLP